MRRVVVTGMAGITALGKTWPEIKYNMLAKKNATCYMPAWEDIKGMATTLGAPITSEIFMPTWSRKKTRTMGKVALYAVAATEEALQIAKLLDDPILTEGRTGVAYGSSAGSTEPLKEFAELLFERDIKNVTATSYIRMMSHTTAVNLSLHFKLTGRLITSSTACTSGSLAIGYAAEAIRSGAQDVMIAGGAEELCPTMAAVFDTLYATSTKNTTPELTPRPFDINRDGIVIGEGAATLILEEYAHAINRGAPIFAEVIGFGTNTDGNHITQPSVATMKKAMTLALEDAKINPQEIGFVNGHGTATEYGDIAESIATYEVFQRPIPIHSLKSYFAHTLGACGSLEAWLAIEMMQDKLFVPTINLTQVDKRCAALDYLMGESRELAINYLMNNNFAFGGINTSLIFKRVS